MNARLIDHQQAIKTMMAERYLLGEMNEGEHDAFEEHMFECPECFEQVRAGTEFVDSLKKIGAEQAAAVPQTGWHQALGEWLRPRSTQIFAVMFLGAVSFSVYQSMLLHQAAAPEIVTVETLRPEARGQGNIIHASRRGSFELRVVFQPEPAAKLGRVQIMDDAGKEAATVPVNDLGQGELQVRFGAGKFHSGKYLLVLKAADQTTGQESVVNQYPFELALQD